MELDNESCNVNIALVVNYEVILSCQSWSGSRSGLGTGALSSIAHKAGGQPGQDASSAGFSILFIHS